MASDRDRLKDLVPVVPLGPVLNLGTGMESLVPVSVRVLFAEVA